MALTDRAFSKIEKYSEFTKSIPFVRRFMRSMIVFLGDIFARMSERYFPENFPWDWKLEMLLGRYEKETTDLFKKIVRPGMTVVDIGAHIGYFTRLCSQLVGPTGRVIAFDADKTNFNLLSQNIKKLRHNNVVLVNKAVSDRDGTIEFYNVYNKTGSHSIIVPKALFEKTVVSSVTLDAFLQESNIVNVDVIKIDIEGGEYYAFLGMKKLFEQKGPLSILCEFCPKHLKNAGIDPAEFLKNMQRLGFSMNEVLPGGTLANLSLPDVPRLSFYEMGYTNILFCKN